VLGAFANAFKTPDLRRKILFVLFIVVIFRIGSVVPAPGVNVKSLHACIDVTKTGANANLYNLINLFSGGALRSSRSASCRTSPPASFCSCSPWSSRGWSR
jgi:preprotein translocase subunit SecY